jgi:hypothetical protein
LPENALVLCATAVRFSLYHPAYILFGLYIVYLTLQLTCCIEEWETGSFKPKLFTPASYSTVYDTIAALVAKINKDPYHCAKLLANRQAWAKAGKYVYIISKLSSNN